MRRIRRVLGLAVTAIILAGPAVVSAKPKKASSAQRKAQREKKRAFKLFKKGDFEAGIAAMESAYRLVDHPGFLLNIAVAFDQWGGHCKDSLIAFDRFLEACGGTCKMLGAAQTRRTEVEAACKGEVTITTLPAGAAIAIDGKAAGTSPLTAPLPVGRHYVTTELAGHEPGTQDFEITEGKVARVLVQLVPVAAPPPDIAPPPPPPPPPPPDRVVAPIRPDSSGVGPWPWVAIGVGAAGIGVGVLFTAQTFSALDAEEAARLERNTKTEVVRLQNDATNKAIVANVGYAIGVVSIVTGVVLLLVGGDESPPDGLTLAPVVSPNAVGLGGRF